MKLEYECLTMMLFRTLGVVFLFLAKGGHSQLNVCGQATLNTRIVGGQNATEGSWPWQVSLQRQGSHFCGGSLINDQWILTAAHCFQSGTTSQTLVKLGMHTLSGNNSNIVTKPISSIFNHPNYNSQTFDNDISLLKLSTAVTFNDYIRPACLAATGSSVFNGTMSWVTGWGRTSFQGSLPSSGILQEVEVPVIGNRKCNCLYGVGNITSNMLCAGALEGGKDSCQGDSGGPLVIKKDSKWIQVGIVSFGIECAQRNFPGVYTKVSQYQDWIDQTISTNQPGFIQVTSSGTNGDLQVSCPGLPPVTPAPTAAPVVCGRAPLNTPSGASSPLASAGAWPWIASLQRNGTHVCGGTLIARQFVMSSADCFSSSTSSSDWTVKLGRLNQNGSNPNEVSVNVADITFSKTGNSDIAVLELSTAPTLSDFIQPICVDLLNINFNTGTQCWAAGWGSGGGAQQTLEQFNTTIVNCGNASSSNSICTEAIPLEQSQTGGPLMCKIGTSWIQAAVLTLNSNSSNSTTESNNSANSATGSNNSSDNTTNSTNSSNNSSNSTNSSNNSTNSSNNSTNSSNNSTNSSNNSTNSSNNSTNSSNSSSNSSNSSSNSSNSSSNSSNSTSNSTNSSKRARRSSESLSDVSSRNTIQVFTKISSFKSFLESIVGSFPLQANSTDSPSTSSGYKPLQSLSVASVFLLSLLSIIQTFGLE